MIAEMDGKKSPSAARRGKQQQQPSWTLYTGKNMPI
jgi:hypothetical protein